MCTFPSAYVDTTAKKVGDLLTASTYAFNSDGTPITTTVYLKGYSMATSTWKTFTSTTPDPTDGWAGMPIISFTNDFIGTWNLSFSAVDKDGSTCGAGPFTLTINPTSTTMTLQSNKVSITNGDTVSFYGTYLPNQNINIFIEGIVRQHVVSVKTDSIGNFLTSAIFTATSDTTYQICACTAGSIAECSLLPDESNYLSINVYMSTVTGWRCIGAGTGLCISGTGNTYTFPDQNTCQTTDPCAVAVAPTKYNCSGTPDYTCSGPFATGTYNSSAECTTACKAGVVTPTGYDCANCNLLVNNGKYTTSAACTTGCAATGGPYYSCNSKSNTCVQDPAITANRDGCTAALFGKTCPGGTTTTPCASDEMLLFGNCQKKNTVYIIGGIAFFALMMTTMKSK